MGVDVERIAPDTIDATLGERRFTRKEVSILRSLEPERRGEAFFWFWVLKEAYLKAMGGGLSIPLDSVETSPDIQDSSGILAHSDSEKWNLMPITQGKGYVAALVTEGGDVNLRYYDWSGPPSGL